MFINLNSQVEVQPTFLLGKVSTVIIGENDRGNILRQENSDLVLETTGEVKVKRQQSFTKKLRRNIHRNQYYLGGN